MTTATLDKAVDLKENTRRKKGRPAGSKAPRVCPPYQHLINSDRTISTYINYRPAVLKDGSVVYHKHTKVRHITSTPGVISRRPNAKKKDSPFKRQKQKIQLASTIRKNILASSLTIVQLEHLLKSINDMNNFNSPPALPSI